jgi:hypothetical protein
MIFTACRSFLILAILIASFANFSLAQPDSWKLEREKEGIKVYSRDNKNSRVQTFKATGAFDHSIEHILAILRMPREFPRWLERCREVQILDSSQSSKTIYMEIQVPFPFSNRDMIQEIKYDTSPDLTTIQLISQPDYLVTKNNLVRLQEANGYWELLKLGPKQTRVTFVFSLDPGGLIPAWIANLFLINGPQKNLSRLKEYLNEQVLVENDSVKPEPGSSEINSSFDQN